MKVATFLVGIGLALLVSGPVWSQQQPADSQLIARLEEMLSKNDWQITTRGGAKGTLLMHRAKLTRIIDQLKSGQPVDPKEIDALIKEHSR